MITFEEAKQIALEKIGPDCGLMVDKIIEKPYGWYFVYQNKSFLESGNRQDMLCGFCGFIVDREDGYVFEFGSAYPLERNFATYEAGFKYYSYNLTILSIINFSQTLEWLLTLNLEYTLPEEEYGDIWRIPKKFATVQLMSALTLLPHTFFDQHFLSRVDEFLKVDSLDCCQYQLHGCRTDGRLILVRQSKIKNP
jgi:hypothetical protein